MDDALLVRVLDAVADLGQQVQAGVQVQRHVLAGVGDRFALDALHGEERHPVCGGPGVEDLRDRRMLHLRQRLPLDLEEGALAGIEALPAQQLERHRAPDRLELFGPVHRTHAALAEHGLEAIAMCEGSTGEHERGLIQPYFG